MTVRLHKLLKKKHRFERKENQKALKKAKKIQERLKKHPVPKKTSKKLSQALKRIKEIQEREQKTKQLQRKTTLFEEKIFKRVKKEEKGSEKSLLEDIHGTILLNDYLKDQYGKRAKEYQALYEEIGSISKDIEELWKRTLSSNNMDFVFAAWKMLDDRLDEEYEALGKKRMQKSDKIDLGKLSEQAKIQYFIFKSVDDSLRKNKPRKQVKIEPKKSGITKSALQEILSTMDEDERRLKPEKNSKKQLVLLFLILAISYYPLQTIAAVDYVSILAQSKKALVSLVNIIQDMTPGIEEYLLYVYKNFEDFLSSAQTTQEPPLLNERFQERIAKESKEEKQQQLKQTPTLPLETPKEEELKVDLQTPPPKTPIIQEESQKKESTSIQQLPSETIQERGIVLPRIPSYDVRGRIFEDYRADKLEPRPRVYALKEGMPDGSIRSFEADLLKGNELRLKEQDLLYWRKGNFEEIPKVTFQTEGGEYSEFDIPPGKEEWWYATLNYAMLENVYASNELRLYYEDWNKEGGFFPEPDETYRWSLLRRLQWTQKMISHRLQVIFEKNPELTMPWVQDTVKGLEEIADYLIFRFIDNNLNCMEAMENTNLSNNWWQRKDRLKIGKGYLEHWSSIYQRAKRKQIDQLLKEQQLQKESISPTTKPLLALSSAPFNTKQELLKGWAGPTRPSSNIPVGHLFFQNNPGLTANIQPSALPSF